MRGQEQGEGLKLAKKREGGFVRIIKETGLEEQQRHLENQQHVWKRGKSLWQKIRMNK